MIGHPGDEMGLVVKGDSGVEHAAMRGSDIGDLEVENGAGVIEFRFLGRREHETHTAAVEKTQLAGLKERAKAELVAVKSCGTIGIMDINGNLADGGNGCGCEIRDGLHGIVISSKFN